MNHARAYSASLSHSDGPARDIYVIRGLLYVLAAARAPERRTRSALGVVRKYIFILSVNLHMQKFGNSAHCTVGIWIIDSLRIRSRVSLGQYLFKFIIITIWYDKQTKAINFRPYDQKKKLKILESKDAISRRIIDMVTFDSRFLN